MKNLVDALASIGALVDDEDLMAVTLNGLGKDYSQFRTSIAVREIVPDFQDLITLLISEEMRVVGTPSNEGSQENVFYSNSNRGRGRGVKTSFRGRHESSHGGHHQHEGQSHGGGRGNFRRRGSHGGRAGNHRGQQPNNNSNCYYCEKPGHMAKNCYQREHDARNGKLQQGNYASTSNQGDEQLFVMQHMENSTIGGVSDNNV